MMMMIYMTQIDPGARRTENDRNPAESVGVRDARLRRWGSLKTIQDYIKRLLGFTTGKEVIMFKAGWKS